MEWLYARCWDAKYDKYKCLFNDEINSCYWGLSLSFMFSKCFLVFNLCLVCLLMYVFLASFWYFNEFFCYFILSLMQLNWIPFSYFRIVQNLKFLASPKKTFFLKSPRILWINLSVLVINNMTLQWHYNNRPNPIKLQTAK